MLPRGDLPSSDSANSRHRDRTLVNLLEVEGAPLQVEIELS
ncbi:MAG: hypothetical protein ACREMX_09065 [Gemmatimonadales bacterium]